jgi:hypothetical protein
MQSLLLAELWPAVAGPLPTLGTRRAKVFRMASSDAGPICAPGAIVISESVGPAAAPHLDDPPPNLLLLLAATPAPGRPAAASSGDRPRGRSPSNGPVDRAWPNRIRSPSSCGTTPQSTVGLWFDRPPAGPTPELSLRSGPREGGLVVIKLDCQGFDPRLSRAPRHGCGRTSARSGSNL